MTVARISESFGMERRMPRIDRVQCCRRSKVLVSRLTIGVVEGSRQPKKLGAGLEKMLRTLRMLTLL
jgi:hypothetical protein